MSKDFFQRNIDVMNDLRTEQFKVKEYLQRGKYRMKQKFFNKGKKHYDFDLNSQEYFHEQLYDISFQNSQVQEQFNNAFIKLMQQSPQFRNQSKYCIEGTSNRINQSQIRHQLYRFFNNRAYDLQYQKYQILQRLHNINAEEEITFVKSRINLIDKEINMAIQRSDRLSCQDYFEETYTLGGKPIPINQNGQSIYKYLDQEDCWYSNVHRDDILIYARNKIFKRDIFNQHFYPVFYEIKHMVKVYGMDLLVQTEDQLAREKQSVRESALKQSKKIISILQHQLESISPGNLVEKENINTFIFTIFGVEQHQLPLNLPLYPTMYSELLQNYNKILPSFFKSLQFNQHRQLISLMPKFTNFCAILFKYQNKQILQGKQQIKLGLQDDIDIRKELHTMLQEIWVNKFVKTDFDRFDYRYRLQTIDWPIDTITDQLHRQRQHKRQSSCLQRPDLPTKEMINLLKSTSYNTFRKHMKKHSEIVFGRLKDKFRHMEQINKYNVLSNEEQTLEQLGELFRIKFNQKEIHSASILKENAALFFQMILKKHIVNNPVQIQIQEMMRIIKVREMRVKLTNVFNGMRCYHRNLALDLRVISGMQFQFQLDDQMLINSNKQAFQNFQKAVKDTQTYFSRASNQNIQIKLTQEQFIQHQNYQKSKVYKRDRVSCHFYGEQIPHILVSHGSRLKNKILYDIVSQDIQQLQNRLLMTCTNFINRYERFLKIRNLQELVDRVELLTQVYEMELEYQYQKFKLIEAYYYIYENTKEPLQAFKISKIIVQLINREPQLDLEETSFADCYRFSIEAIRQQIKIVNHLVQKIQSIEKDNCKIFHDKFARSLNIPLTLQAFLYGDLQKKGAKTVNKLQRMNSMNSKMSKQSRNQKNQKNMKVDNQIKQNFEEGDSDQSSDSFDLENYDEYLLRKNMDAIFDDMVGGDQNGHVKEAAPVNTVALQNLVVNPKFQGGPHIKTNIFPQVQITSHQRQNLINFTQVLHIVGNIHETIELLRCQFQKQFGYCSAIYQLAFLKQLTKRLYKVCLSPDALPPKWLPFETDDPYFQITTKGMRYYEEMMAACLDPPSNVQLAIPSTFQRHHQKMPVYGALQYFDFHSIHSLIQLKRPVNAFKYKESNIGINFVELMQLQDKIWYMQLQRRQLSKAYQNIGKHCQQSMQRSLSEYTNSGQSEVFLATQQIKAYNADITKFAVFGDMLDEVRQYLTCELAELQVFGKYIQLSKRQLQDLIIMKYQIDKPFINKRIDKSRILAPKDPKDIKKIKNRILNVISAKSNDILKHMNFLRFKSSLKIVFESRWKEITQTDYDSRIENRDKMTPFCLNILTTKYKRYMQMMLLESYSKDLMQTTSKLLVGAQICTFIDKLNNYTTTIPFLGNLLVVPTEDKIIESKVFYDQGKNKKLVPQQQNMMIDGEIKKIYYIYNLRQFLQEWYDDNNFPVTSSVQKFDTKICLTGLIPPNSKQLIFKWAFRIPDTGIDINERDSLNFLMNVFHPYTGKLTQLSYKQNNHYLLQSSRNKYLTLMNHYKSLVEYIQAQILVISLQVDEGILDSMANIIKKKIRFQERYFLTDQNSIRETINTLENQDLAVVFNYVINFKELNKQVEQKIDQKHYLESKEHWAVHDQITDFVMSRVQGYGLIRQSYLPLFEDLKLLKEFKGNQNDFLTTKTQNIYKLIYLSSHQTFLNGINQNNSDFYAYHNKINEWLCHKSKIQDYAIAGDDNNRVNISNFIGQNQEEKERFSSGIYIKNTNTLVNRLKHVAIIPAVNLTQFMKKQIFKYQNEENCFSYKHQTQFIWDGMKCFKLMGQVNRLKLFARIRYHYDLSDNFISTKPSSISLIDRQTNKSSFYDLLINKKVLTLACIAFTGRVKLPVNAKQFKQVYMTLKEVNQINTHNLYSNLQQFKQQNKIQFGKSQIALIGKNEGGNDEEFNNIIKQVLGYKLIREQFRFRVLSESIRILKAERLPKTQPKRILNTSLIPRVHLISSYSSPLIMDRKTYISQQYKLSFLQAFINRFRNKVSRVDLLSSGYGFVITVPDLEDCVNYMNKLLFTFTEKQFKNRIQTFSQYYEILIESVNQKNKLINEQSALIKHLQKKNANLLEAEYLSKVTKLLHQKTLIQDKLHVVQNNINGLEDRVRKVVSIQYEKKIQKLEKENQELKAIFSKVKHLHMINTKEAAKNDYLDIMNYYRQKIAEVLSKKIDFSISFQGGPSSQQYIKVYEQENKDKYKSQDKRQSSDKYITEDLQRCKLGEDILFDPYYATKLINKMRLFNLFKMGSKRMKFDQDQFRKDQKLTELHKIQDVVVAQSQREILIRNQLNKVQEELSKKCLDLQKIKMTFDAVQNQKTKLKILMQSKEKKIQQKDRQLDELKKKLQEKDQAITGLIQKEKTSQKMIEENTKLSTLRKQKKYKKVDRLAFITNVDSESNPNSMSLYDKFELSNKDTTWRQKCEQLYIQNKRLQSELDKYQNNFNSMNSTPATPKRDAYSLNMRNKRDSLNQSVSQKGEHRFPNISFKYNILKQGQY